MTQHRSETPSDAGCSCNPRQATIDADLNIVCAECGARIADSPEELEVGDLVTGIFRGEKPITYVDNQSVMVQITPSYEQAYFRSQVRKVTPEPGPERCDPCADPGMTFNDARELGRSVAMCTSHWNRWVARWVNADDTPGVNAHLIAGDPAAVSS